MKNPQQLDKRRKMVIERVKNSNHPSHEIQRLADELFLDKSTIYRDLENAGYPKNAYYYENKHGFNGIN